MIQGVQIAVGQSDCLAGDQIVPFVIDPDPAARRRRVRRGLDHFKESTRDPDVSSLVDDQDAILSGLKGVQAKQMLATGRQLENLWSSGCVQQQDRFAIIFEEWATNAQNESGLCQKSRVLEPLPISTPFNGRNDHPVELKRFIRDRESDGAQLRDKFGTSPRRNFELPDAPVDGDKGQLRWLAEVRQFGGQDSRRDQQSIALSDLETPSAVQMSNSISIDTEDGHFIGWQSRQVERGEIDRLVFLKPDRLPAQTLRPRRKGDPVSVLTEVGGDTDLLPAITDQP
jgi:hypothetical protein